MEVDLFVMSNECVMSRVKIEDLLHIFLVAQTNILKMPKLHPRLTSLLSPTNNDKSYSFRPCI